MCMFEKEKMNNGGYKNSYDNHIQQQKSTVLFADRCLEYLRACQPPYFIEWSLAWMAIILVSGFYIVDYLRLIVRMTLVKRSPHKWYRIVPLTTIAMTKSRIEVSSTERFKRLSRLTTTSNQSNFTDEQLFELLRSNPTARHIASLCMENLSSGMQVDTIKYEQDLQLRHNRLLEDQLQRIWPALMQVPAIHDDRDYPYTISLIIPAYKELSIDVAAMLEHALRNCQHPTMVQVLVVDAGGCTPNLSDTIHDHQQQLLQTQFKHWGEIKIIKYNLQGGRGSCLNYGAVYARAKFLTFLHSDTLLPKNWDAMIIHALDNNDRKKSKYQTYACAFHSCINLSDPTKYRPPGIVGAYKILAYIRCKLCSLPYGDSVLSLPATYFHHLGGYPDQPIMEDYELVSLLRKRAQLLDERLVILPAQVECSPRRWQATGVCYTILVNALCVHRYKNGVTADELFKLYYL